MQAIQKRIGLTSDVISRIKGIKISGLSEFAAQKIRDCRNSEMDDQKAFRRLQISIIALGKSSMPSLRVSKSQSLSSQLLMKIPSSQLLT